MFSFKRLAVFIACFPGIWGAPPQVPLQVPAMQPLQRKLQGRFLQITDMHPDPHYSYRASQSSSCHRNKPKKEKERSGYYGTPYSDCDSPFRLTNFTLDFLDKHWTSDIDFVIWTGDNARHDNDHKIPRTPGEIYDLNRAVAAKMEKVFVSKGIPVVPSLGNNDVWLSMTRFDIKNILTPGPNSVTNTFSSIWKPFIPFPSYQVFQRGAYYSVEVIPNKVAAISLNTMYFYENNKAVGGCVYTEPNDPGNLQFDWLEVQLETFRSRGVKVWISGHVPAKPANYFPECYVRYVELSLRFQDTILGHLFGHLNADHFSFLEARDLQIFPEDLSLNSTPHTSSKGLYEALLNDFADLVKVKKSDHDDYAVINVSPSVVPSPYLPSFRVFSYNITGIDTSHQDDNLKKKKKGHPHGNPANKDAKCKEKEYRDTWKCRLKEDWHSDPDAPSRTNTLWSPLGYAQYYIPDLDSANKSHRPKFKLEYLTYPLEHLHPVADSEVEIQYPVPLQQLPRSLRNETLTKSKYAPYGMKDLTIPSWLKLAGQLGQSEKTKLRKRFKKYMFMGGEEG